MGDDTLGIEKDASKDVIDIAAVWVYYAIWLVIGFYSLTAGRGLEEEINFTTIVLFTLPLLMYAGLVTAVNTAKLTGKFENFVVFVHDTEIGIFGKFRFVSNPLLLIFVSSGIFILIGFFGAIMQSTIGDFFFPWSVGGLPETTTGAKLVFGVYNAPAENAWLYLILAGLVTTELLVLRKLTGLSAKQIYWPAMIFNVPAAGFIWLQIHNLINKTAEQSINHFAFGATNAALVLGTGSIIPTEAYHFFNNLFFTMQSLFGNQLVITIFSFMAVIYVALLIFIFIFKGKIGKRGSFTGFGISANLYIVVSSVKRILRGVCS